MMWVAWRQQKYVYLVLAAATTILIGWALFNGSHSQALLSQYYARPCNNGNGIPAKDNNACMALFESWSHSIAYDHLIADFAQALAILIGTVLGVGVASELERKTARLAWTQSLTRTRWLTTKSLVGVASMAALLVPLCVTFTWWVKAARYGARVAPLAFPLAGWMLGVYAVFAFVLVVFVGILIRRAGWAIAVALALFGLTIYAMQVDVRSHLVDLHVATITTEVLQKGSVIGRISRGGAPSDAWLVFSGYLPNHSRTSPASWGAELRMNKAVDTCVGSDVMNLGQKEASCLRQLGLRDAALYMSDQDFWTLQMREGGLYLALSALLFGVSVVAIRRVTV